mgnify:CR=1 FL=1
MGSDIAGMPARFAVTVKTSSRYIAYGSAECSPIRKAGVGVVAGEGEDRVGQAATLPDLLEEAARQSPTQDLVGHGQRIAVGVAEGQGMHAEGDVRLLRALEEPLKQLANNVGKDDGAVIVEKGRGAGGNSGYDAAKAEIITDMIKAGIIDPVKVERAAVQHAVSAAAVLLTSEVAIADAPEPEKPASGKGC